MDLHVGTAKRRAGRGLHLLVHLLVLICLLVAAVALATLSGGLWPFDLRFSALIAASGIAVLTIAWWPATLTILAIAALLPRLVWRLAVWPMAVLAMAALHGVFGPDLGFAPLASLGIGGALRLYLIPTALAALAGSALREAFSGKPALMPAPERSSP